ASTTCAVCTLWLASASHSEWSHGNLYRKTMLVLSNVGSEGVEIARLTAGKPSATGQAYRDAMGSMKNSYPLPQFDKETVDIFPHQVLLLLASDLNYKPRPSIQSYCAYTPKLAQWNADYYKGTQAPESVAFAVGAIDFRLPSMEDSLTWLELITRYDVVDESPLYLKLRKSPVPR